MRRAGVLAILAVACALALVSAFYAVGVTVTGPLQAFGWEWVGGVPGTATAVEAARFLPLVVAAVVLTALASRTRASAGSTEGA